jgi:hypothetical protein
MVRYPQLFAVGYQLLHELRRRASKPLRTERAAVMTAREERKKGSERTYRAPSTCVPLPPREQATARRFF